MNIWLNQLRVDEYLTLEVCKQRPVFTDLLHSTILRLVYKKKVHTFQIDRKKKSHFKHSTHLNLITTQSGIHFNLSAF